jgi:hypothetical protein
VVQTGTREPEQARVVIYTAVFGKFPDKLYPPDNIPGNVPCYAFVDGVKKPTKRDGWTCLPAFWEHATNPRLRARRHKILAHEIFPVYDYTLWVDGCLTPKTDPHELIERYLVNADIAVFRHMQRGCLYRELEACIKLKKDDPGVMRRQVRRYRGEGYPYNNGLGETTALLRRHNSTVVPGDHVSVNTFSRAWWEELRSNSVRDQLSFDYLIWKYKLKYNTFEGVRPNSPYFYWRRHR